MEEPKKYKVHLTPEAQNDILELKKYILDTFKYRETAVVFTKNIKHAIKQLEIFPTAYPGISLAIHGKGVYYKPCNSYLIFYIIKDDAVIIIRIIKDRMYWQPIISRIHNI